jgi:hypothetical protein
MFVREKRIGPYTYVYLVETAREQGTAIQFSNCCTYRGRS